MAENKIHYDIVVVQEGFANGVAPGFPLNDKQKVTGVFTDGDLRRTLKKNPDITNLTLKNFMTKNYIKIDDDILAAEALTIMEECEITSLIVIDKKNSLKGFIPAFVNIKVGSSFITMGADGTILCSFDSKKSRNFFLMSYDFIQLVVFLLIIF